MIHKYGQQRSDYLSSWDIYNHEVLAYIDGKKVSIPTSKAKALETYDSKVPILELKKSTDKDLQFLADFIYDKIFVKQWGMRPEEMDGAVTARVPVFIGRDNRYFNDSYLTMAIQI